MILTNAVGNADGTTWAASDRLRFQEAPRIAPVVVVEGDESVLDTGAQTQGGIPPRKEPR